MALICPIFFFFPFMDDASWLVTMVLFFLTKIQFCLFLELVSFFVGVGWSFINDTSYKQCHFF